MRPELRRSSLALYALSSSLVALGCSGSLAESASGSRESASGSREPAAVHEPLASERAPSEREEHAGVAPARGEAAGAGEASAGGGAAGEPAPSEPTRGAEPARATGWFASPRQGARIFASGHSLIDHVFGPMSVNAGPITALARHAGKDHHSVFQGGPGSPARLRREDIERGRFPAPDWGSFDVLVLTERNDPHGCVIWENTAGEHGWVIDRVREAGGQLDEVFVYQTWWGFSARNPPTLRTWPAWAAYQREELPLHECIAQQVSRSRRVTTRVLPAGLALAELMVAIDAGRIPGLSAYDIFNRDNIHLGELGNRFIAMVVYASVYRTPTRGIPMAGMPEAQATAMQAIVDRVVSDYYARTPRHGLDQCRSTLARLCERHQSRCDHQLTQAFPDGSI